MLDDDDGSLLPGAGAGNGVSFREAIKYGLPGGTIVFQPSLSGGVIVLGGTHIGIADNLTVDASGLDSRITIDADLRSRIFDILAPAEVSLIGLKLTRGKAPDGADGPFGREAGEHGGAVRSAGSLTLTGCEVSDSEAGSGFDGGRGGGIYSDGNLVIADCRISNNLSGRADDVEGVPSGGGSGGGIFDSTGNLTISSSHIVSNETGRGGDSLPSDFFFRYGGAGGDGGGVAKFGGTLNIVDSVISDNRTGVGGFGVNDPFGGEGSPGNSGSGAGLKIAANSTITRCTISGNVTGATRLASSGGGVSAEGSLMMNSCVVSDNRATFQTDSSSRAGGGISFYGTQLELQHVTLVNNRAHRAGGIWVDDDGVTFSLDHSIVASNIAMWGEQNIEAPSMTGSNNFISGDPMLAELGDYGGVTPTMPPRLGSPVIDAGAASSPVATDQRGLPRVVGGAIDIGSYESGSPAGYPAWAAENLSLGDGQSGDFDGDADGDGTSNGLLYAVGSGGKPSLAAGVGGAVHLSFGYRVDAALDVIWLIYRSEDLSGTEELLRIEDGVAELAGGVQLDGTPPAYTFVDLSPPEGRAFYWLTVQLR